MLKKLFIAGFALVSSMTLMGCSGGEAPIVDEDAFINYASTYEFDLLNQVEGKSYLMDGYGVVELVATGDGDTARFCDPNLTDAQKADHEAKYANGTYRYNWDNFSLRFYSIDTPETSGTPEAYGKEAGYFASYKLENAQQIVLSSVKNGSPALREGYGRYLGFVWVDGVCLNVEIIQNGYSNWGVVSGADSWNTMVIAAANQAQRFGLNWAKVAFQK